VGHYGEGGAPVGECLAHVEAAEGMLQTESETRCALFEGAVQAREIASARGAQERRFQACAAESSSAPASRASIEARERGGSWHYKPPSLPPRRTCRAKLWRRESGVRLLVTLGSRAPFPRPTTDALPSCSRCATRARSAHFKVSTSLARRRLRLLRRRAASALAQSLSRRSHARLASRLARVLRSLLAGT
jgi:hypothetical protein